VLATQGSRAGRHVWGASRITSAALPYAVLRQLQAVFALAAVEQLDLCAGQLRVAGQGCHTTPAPTAMLPVTARSRSTAR